MDKKFFLNKQGPLIIVDETNVKKFFKNKNLSKILFFLDSYFLKDNSKILIICDEKTWDNNFLNIISEGLNTLNKKIAIHNLEKKFSKWFSYYIFKKTQFKYLFLFYFENNKFFFEIFDNDLKHIFFKKELIDNLVIYENQISNRNFYKLKNKNFAFDMLVTIYDLFFVRKNDDKLLNVNFINDDDFINYCQKLLSLLMDINFSIGTKKFFSKQKTDLKIYLEKNNDLASFYYKKKNHFLKITFSEVLVIIHHFLNKESTNNSFVINNNFDKMLNIETNNNGNNILKINFLGQLVFENIDDKIKNNPLIPILLVISFLNYKKTQFQNFEKIKELLQKFYSYKNIDILEWNKKINIKEFVNFFISKKYKVVKIKKENNEYWNLVFTLQNKKNHVIKFFTNTKIQKNKILFEMDTKQKKLNLILKALKKYTI
ncbi:hypothetical protein [Mesomycoplasma neurolyticum]|uniref:Uncharacterized protein n=1 Tax=Mesomycoplasma neurolyticum TaxID=2120 RepID=A0A449A5W3_9BACT|nr:hypothetical protein [Mesomycoplasma neurolyticum]VEU59645.1 Uncharacterised protein [Mesomycoplasma neurolyticum]